MDLYKAYQKKYREEHKSEISVYNKKYRAEHKEQLKADRKKYYNKDAERERSRDRRVNDYQQIYKNELKSVLKRRYGISVEQYDEMLNRQGGKCAICGKPKTERRFDIDHNHTTGKIRGLLCNNCNQGIGKFKDSLDIIEKAIKYLRENI